MIFYSSPRRFLKGLGKKNPKIPPLSKAHLDQLDHLEAMMEYLKIAKNTVTCACNKRTAVFVLFKNQFVQKVPNTSHRLHISTTQSFLVTKL